MIDKVRSYARLVADEFANNNQLLGSWAFVGVPSVFLLTDFLTNTLILNSNFSFIEVEFPMFFVWGALYISGIKAIALIAKRSPDDKQNLTDFGTYIYLFSMFIVLAVIWAICLLQFAGYFPG